MEVGRPRQEMVWGGGASARSERGSMRNESI